MPRYFFPFTFSCLIFKFCTFKNPFWKGDLHFLYVLEMITAISNLLIFSLSHTHKYIISAFSSWILFPIASALFQDFLPNKTHVARIYLWFIETQSMLHIDCYLFQEHRKIGQIQQFLSCFFLLLYIKELQKISYSKKDIFNLAP